MGGQDGHILVAIHGKCPVVWDLRCWAHRGNQRRGSFFPPGVFGAFRAGGGCRLAATILQLGTQMPTITACPNCYVLWPEITEAVKRHERNCLSVAWSHSGDRGRKGAK